MKKSFREKENLEKIILEGKLKSFILGLDEFLNKHPGTDYQRWIALEKVYKDPNTVSELREQIEVTVNDLFNEQNDLAQYASIAVGRVLELPETVEKIKEIINSSKLETYSINLQNEILFSSIMLQVSEVAVPVLKIFIGRGRLGEFLYCSPIPPHVARVGGNDIWRLDVLRKVYDASDQKTRSAISTDVQQAAKHGRNFRLVMKRYRRLFPQFVEFTKMLKAALPFHFRVV